MKEEKDVWEGIWEDLENPGFAWMVALVFTWARNKGISLDKLSDELMGQRGQ